MEQEIIDGKEVKSIINKKDFVNEAMGIVIKKDKEDKDAAKKAMANMSADEKKTYRFKMKNVKIERYHFVLEQVEEEKKVRLNKREEVLKAGKGFINGWSKFWLAIGQSGFCQTFRKLWTKLELRFPTLSQFVMFTLMSQAVTILQLILMPVLKAIFNQTSLVNISFQFMGIPGAFNLDGSQYYIFDYAAGAIGVLGGGGGLGYFLAIEITLAIAQIINFFVQRNITFKSKSNPWIAAMWYLIAYIAITLIAGALQGLYKAPIYNSFTSSMGSFGTLMADFVTMIINSCISYWVFFPIFKIIFPQKKDKKVK